MIMKVDHVTAVVADSLSVARTLARLFKVEPVGTRELRGMRIVTLPLGDVELHINSPTGPGPVEEHLRARGPGLHHLAAAVDDLDLEIRRLEREGVRCLGAPVATAPGLREIFVDPRDTGGLLLQLVERHLTGIQPSDLESDAVVRLAASSGAAETADDPETP